jgi:ankyrin repeat protein
MSAQTDAPVPQRWERPFPTTPGYWKQQLATKYLAIAGRGDLVALRQLLADQSDWLNKRGPHNRTLLWEATRRGKLAAVQWLLAQGAELEATGCYNNESYVQLTPFCAALYYHRSDIATYLHRQGAQLDIFRAAWLGDLPGLEQALDAQPALLQAEDPCDSIYYVPLLAFAVVGGHTAVVDLLLQRGAVVDCYSAQLLYLAARAARRDFVDRLIAHGADVRVVDSGIFGMVSDLSMLRYLLDHGVSATQVGKNGFSPLIYVARGDKGEHPEKVQLLLEHGASVNTIGPQGRMALHYAAVAGYEQVSTLLVEHGASLTLRDQQGQTALDLAQAAGKTAIVGLLRARGAGV